LNLNCYVWILELKFVYILNSNSNSTIHAAYSSCIHWVVSFSSAHWLDCCWLNGLLAKLLLWIFLIFIFVSILLQLISYAWFWRENTRFTLLLTGHSASIAATASHLVQLSAHWIDYNFSREILLPPPPA
jgi:hypothetical protein